MHSPRVYKRGTHQGHNEGRRTQHGDGVYVCFTFTGKVLSVSRVIVEERIYPIFFQLRCSLVLVKAQTGIHRVPILVCMYVLLDY